MTKERAKHLFFGKKEKPYLMIHNNNPDRIKKSKELRKFNSILIRSVLIKSKWKYRESMDKQKEEFE
jgi:hypothetical protein